MPRKPRVKAGGVASATSRPVISEQKFKDEVKKRAYEIYLNRGSRPGSDVNDWIQAEKELRSKYNIKK